MTNMNTTSQARWQEFCSPAEAADSLTHYLQEIRQYPLLTAAEEQLLSAQVLAGQQAEQALAREGLPEAERMQALAAIAAGRKAREQLVSANLRLVVVIAKTYQNRGLSLMDLIQEGNLGLMKAAARYDGSTGNRFSTCASWWIRQSISRAVTDQGRAIRLPANVYQKVSVLRRTGRELAGELGREATVEELSHATGFSPAKIRDLRNYDQDVTSLDLPLGDGDDSATLGDLAAGTSPMEAVDEAVTYVALQGILRRALATLESREQLVLSMRYGLDGYPVHTLEAISQHLGLTRERVRQIEQRALRRLRTGVESHQLAAFIA